MQVTSPEAAPDAAPAPAPAPAEAGTSEVREEAGAGAEAAHCATPLLDTEVSILSRAIDVSRHFHNV